MTEFPRVQAMVRQRWNYIAVSALAFIAMAFSYADYGRWFVSVVLSLHVVIWSFVLGELSRDIENARQRESNEFRARTQQD